MKTFFISLLIIFSTHIVPVYSQDCASKKTHAQACQQPFDFDYEDTGKSMSFPIYKGKSQKLVITLAGKKDYYLAVCTETDEKLSFKIMNANNPEEIIYDNAGFDRSQNVEFSMSYTNKILIEISLPLVYGVDYDKKPICVGMLLFQKAN